MKIHSNKRWFLFISLILMMSILVTACSSVGGQKSTVATTTVVDGLNRTVEIPSNPQRIISLAPSNTELLFAVGAGSQVVGRDEFSDFPEDAKSIASVGGSMGKYSLEQIAALKPDLVLASELNTPEVVQSIADLGVNVYYLANPADLNGMLANITLVGSLVGHSAEAEQLVASLRVRIDKATQLTDAGSPRVTVFYELDGTSDPAKPWTVGSGTFIDELINLAGGTNVAAEAGPGYLQLSQEALIVYDPQVILLGDAAYGVTVDSLSQRTGWEAISAVQGDRVYAFDDNLVSRPGPRLVDGLELISSLLNK